MKTFSRLKTSAYEVYTPKELALKYPNLTMGPEIWGLLDQSAGILFSDKALAAIWVNSESKSRSANLLPYTDIVLSYNCLLLHL